MIKRMTSALIAVVLLGAMATAVGAQLSSSGKVCYSFPENFLEGTPSAQQTIPVDIKAGDKFMEIHGIDQYVGREQTRPDQKSERVKILVLTTPDIPDRINPGRSYIDGIVNIPNDLTELTANHVGDGLGTRNSVQVESVCFTPVQVIIEPPITTTTQAPIVTTIPETTVPVVTVPETTVKPTTTAAPIVTTTTTAPVTTTVPAAKPAEPVKAEPKYNG